MVNIFGKQNPSGAKKQLDTKKEMKKKRAAKGQGAVATKSVKVLTLSPLQEGIHKSDNYTELCSIALADDNSKIQQR